MKTLQPLRVAYVRLAARNMLGVAGIDQKDLETAFVEQFEYRDPVDAGRFHGYVRSGTVAGIPPDVPARA